MDTVPISIFLTTQDEEKNLPYALASVMDWAQDVFVLDSGSTDRTRKIAEKAGASFLFRPWEGYARTKNWGLDYLPFAAPWVFILDADEVITPPLREELIAVATDPNCDCNAYYVNRYFIFMNRKIRHCGYYPSWNVRFLRRGKARYEEREVHEHMIVAGKVGHLRHDMEHYDRRGMEYLIFKHNHYSTLEAREMFRIITGTSTETTGSFFGPAAERRRWIKHKIWPHLPVRWFLRWLYMYVLRAGFLDGAGGFHLCLFLASYEHQVGLKLKEMLAAGTNGQSPVAPSPLANPEDDAVAPGKTATGGKQG